MANPEATVGRAVLFIGNECQGWQPGDFAAAAKRARGLGVDTLCPKRADGSIRWYGDVARLEAESAAVHAAGCGYIPMAYCYGPAYGVQQIDDETAVLAEFLNALGFGVADLEVEWDGRPDAAAQFNQRMLPVPGMLYLTTWADPVEQGWADVVRALAPCVNAWVPQQYNDWLGAQRVQEIALGESHIEPALDLSQEFGANHPASIAQSARNAGAGTLWLWEYLLACGAQRQLAQRIVALMHGGSAAVAASPAVASVAASVAAPDARAYTVAPGETLSGIAAKLGIPDWHALYDANTAVIGPDPNLIQPGTTLRY